MTVTRKPDSIRNPRFQRIRLDQIEPDLSLDIRSLSHLRYVTTTVPSILPDAIDLLQVIQPLIVIEKSRLGDECRSYSLLAGRRTYQLMLEHLPRKSRDKVWALLLPKEFKYGSEAIRAFDSVITKVILHPDDADLAQIGAMLLEDAPLRSSLSKFIDVSSDSKIADYLGYSKATLHRKTEPIRKLYRAQKSDEPEGTVAMDIDDPSES